jgi:hypothetical protein
MFVFECNMVEQTRIKVNRIYSNGKENIKRQAPHRHTDTQTATDTHIIHNAYSCCGEYDRPLRRLLRA